MAIALVQQTNTWNVVGSSIAIAFASNPVIGNLVVCFAWWSGDDGSLVVLPTGWLDIQSGHNYECNKNNLRMTARKVRAGDFSAGGPLGFFGGIFGTNSASGLVAAEFSGVPAEAPSSSLQNECGVIFAAGSPNQLTLSPNAPAPGSLVVIGAMNKGFTGTASWAAGAATTLLGTVAEPFANIRAMGYRTGGPGNTPAALAMTNSNDAWGGFQAAAWSSIASSSFAGEPGGSMW